MSSKPYKSKEDLERESLELALTERRFALGRPMKVKGLDANLGT
jgi:hypothetical protein